MITDRVNLQRAVRSYRPPAGVSDGLSWPYLASCRLGTYSMHESNSADRSAVKNHGGTAPCRDCLSLHEITKFKITSSAEKSAAGFNVTRTGNYLAARLLLNPLTELITPDPLYNWGEVKGEENTVHGYRDDERGRSRGEGGGDRGVKPNLLSGASDRLTRMGR